MVIPPVYIYVNEGARWLRLTATSYTDNTQLVRVWATLDPQERTKLMEFPGLELQLRSCECQAKDIPPVGARPYWLAVLVFQKVGSFWERSASGHAGPCKVPEIDLAFAMTSVLHDARSHASNDAALSIIYA